MRQLKEKVWQKANKCRGNRYCSKGRQAGVKPHLFFFHTHFRKEMAVFFYEQQKGTHTYQAWGAALEKGNSPFAESTASGGRASSTSSNRSMPWKCRGFYLGIACSELEDKLHLCTRLCVSALLSCQKLQTEFDLEKDFFFGRAN